MELETREVGGGPLQHRHLRRCLLCAGVTSGDTTPVILHEVVSRYNPRGSLYPDTTSCRMVGVTLQVVASPDQRLQEQTVTPGGASWISPSASKICTRHILYVCQFETRDVGGSALLDRDFCRCMLHVDIRLPGKGNSNSHGARPVH